MRRKGILLGAVLMLSCICFPAVGGMCNFTGTDLVCVDVCYGSPDECGASYQRMGFAGFGAYGPRNENLDPGGGNQSTWVNECHYEYYDFWEECDDREIPIGGGVGGGIPGSDPPSDPPNSNPLDQNNDGKMDCWKNSVNTADPNADTLDANDGLGSNFGGPNTTRPGHDGIDRQCDAGDTINSPLDGVVKKVNKGWRQGGDTRGNFVIVERCASPGQQCQTVALYHMTDVTVNVGDHVSVGTGVGTCGSTGNSTGDHLHLKYSDASGTVQDPAGPNGFGNCP